MTSPDDKRPASLRADGAARSRRRGDVPEEILARYLTDTARGRTLGFYVDARVTRPAFRDRGDRLFADRNDPAAIGAMVAIAHHRGWSTVQVRGDERFRHEVWLQARRHGLEVRGYAPTSRDLELESRAVRRPPPKSRSESPPGPIRPLSAARRTAIVEAVVAARMLDPARAQRLLEAARARVAPIIPAFERRTDRQR